MRTAVAFTTNGRWTNGRWFLTATAIACALLSVSALAQPVAPLSLPTVASNRFLTWDANGSQEWKVYTGPARGAWTNSVFVKTNRITYKPGVFYGVSAWSPALNVESATINYPSNRVVALVVETHDLDLRKVGEFTWLTYTNAATGRGKLLKLREDFLRWE